MLKKCGLAVVHDHDAFNIRCTPQMRVECCMQVLPFSSILPIELQNWQTLACSFSMPFL